MEFLWVGERSKGFRGGGGMLVRKVIPVVDTLCFPKQGTKFSRSVIFRNEGVGE